jgi:diguanylate cyclase (GGDEF)-like protein
MKMYSRAISYVERLSKPALLAICLAFVLAVTAMDLYWNLAAQVILLAAGAFLIIALKDTLAGKKDLERKDPMTGALNGKAFIELARREINRNRRYEGLFTFAHIDIDNFKDINAKFGHSAGDEILRSVAAILKGNLRNVDIVARLGGDEFALVMPETAHEGAVVVMGRLRNLLADGMHRNGWPATFTIGVVTYKNPPDNVDAMIRRASDLMRETKEAGKDMIRYEVV